MKALLESVGLSSSDINQVQCSFIHLVSLPGVCVCQNNFLAVYASVCCSIATVTSFDEPLTRPSPCFRLFSVEAPPGSLVSKL